MGCTPIPRVHPHYRQYLPGLDGELVDVTGFWSGPRQQKLPDRHVAPPDPWHYEAVNLLFTLCLLLLVIVPILWWAI